MGIYHMLVNDKKKEYLYFVNYNINVKTFVNPTVSMIIAWVLQYSDLQGDNIRIINDTSADTEDEWTNIKEQYKNREDDFVKGYLEYIEDLDGFGQYSVEEKQNIESVKP